MPREELAAKLWREIAVVTGLPADLPHWQIVNEKRATMVASPAQDAKRPGPKTGWRNFFLAGDWTQTGLPATIEGAVLSGERAAEFARAEVGREGEWSIRSSSPSVIPRCEGVFRRCKCQRLLRSRIALRRIPGIGRQLFNWI